MPNKHNLLFVFGTRPEVIKMAPVIKEFQKYPDLFVCHVCVTGQHRQMIDPLLDLFEIRPDYDLNLMKTNQNLEHITTSVLQEVGKILQGQDFQYLIVQGDTTTGMAASLAAFYNNVKIAHVEAGLRTGNIRHPFPEEVNRKIIDNVSDLYFAHTEAARDNLLKEGVDPKKIEVTGNTVIDALLDTANKPFNQSGSALEKLSFNGRRVILMTAHRRENCGTPILDICKSVKEVALRYEEDVLFVYPVHLNPNIKKPVHDLLEGLSNVVLTPPMDYLPFVQLMKQSYFILTDSGGLQEEAPSLGKPVLVLRETTERPEGVEAGCVEVIGTKVEYIIAKICELLDDPKKYAQMAQARNPYGNGKASQKIVQRFIRDGI